MKVKTMLTYNGETEQEPDETSRIDEEKILKIGGINWQDGLDCFAGDREVYFSVVRSYADHTAHIVAQICNVTEATLSDYAIRIHGIKGSSYGIKANEIGKQAEELEHAAKAGDFQFVSLKTPVFVENTKKLLAALSELFETNTTDEKPNRSAPDESLLDQMEEAAANFNIDELEEIIKSLECFNYETQAELISWLHEKVNQMDFLAINERLTQRKQRLSGD